MAVAALEGEPISKTSSEDGTLDLCPSHFQEADAGGTAILSCPISYGFIVCQVSNGCETK